MSKCITTSAGGREYSLNAFISCRLLREHGCNLPYVWAYIGEQELNKNIQDWLKSNLTNIEFLDVSQYIPEQKDIYKHTKGGWQSKPIAVKYSPYDEVLFMDSDCMPLKDPSYLFSDYNNALFFPDKIQFDREPKSIEYFGCKWDLPFSMESGQFIVDRRKCGNALDLTIKYNLDPRTYELVYGDKDTFYFGWRNTKTEFDFITVPLGHYPYQMFIQHDKQGTELFAHLVYNKFVPFGRNRFPHCLDRSFIESCIIKYRENNDLWE